jgi:membrane-bound ClpP family serine protease
MECFVDKEGVWTAVGCIPQDPASAIESLVKIGLGIAGGVVLIMIIVGAFMLSASQGDPNKVGEAKEIITSAIIGLIFIIFSVTLLQFIGVEILHIPGFGE